MPSNDNPTNRNPDGGGTGVAGGGNQGIPVEVVQTLRDEIKELKETTSIQAEQLRLYQANAGRGQTGGNADTAKHSTGGGFLEGMEDDDVVTVKDVRKAMAGQESKMAAVVAAIDVKSSRGDFDQLVNKYGPILARERPDLAAAIRSSNNPALLLYENIKLLPQYQKDLAQNQIDTGDDKGKGLNEEAKKLLENQTKPGAASGAGGGGGTGDEGLNFYLNMSDEDLEKRIEATKNKA